MTYDEQFNSAVTCTTALFQGGLPKRSIGHNTWVRNYDPEREKEATGSAAQMEQSALGNQQSKKNKKSKKKNNNEQPLI